MEKNVKIPKLGIIMCNSGASNTGYVTGAAVFKSVEKIGNSEKVGICSLPALANGVRRQVMLTRKIEHLIVVDGCHQQCAKKILEKVHLDYDEYINLENDLGLEKMGPFTSFEYSISDIEKASGHILKKIGKILSESTKGEKI